MSENKKSCELSLPEKPLSVRDEYIVRSTYRLGEPLPPRLLAEGEALKNRRDREIDLSDAPERPDAKLVRARNLGFAWAQPHPGQRPSRKKNAA